MVRRVIQFIGREITGLHEAAYLLALFAFLSQILALVRDRLLASQFGASHLLDVYYAAFRIPDFIFVIISALVSISVLIPFLVRVIEKDKEHVKDFVDSVFSGFVILILILVGVTLIFTDDILRKIFPEIINGEYGKELVTITYIMLLQPIFLGLSGLFSSFIQVYKKFFIYALSPILYNLGIIIGIYFFYPLYGLQGMVWGVVLGAILHLLIQVPSVINKGIFPRFTFKIKWNYLKDVLKLSLPRTVALTSSQISLIVLVALAGAMITGSISVFTFSFNLQSVPLAIIGVSYSLAAFPTLSRLYANGDIENFLNHIVKAARHIIFWSIPVTVMFIVLRAQIVRSILGAGEFSWDDTRLTAAALAVFAVSVVAQSLILLFVRGYYSAGETKKPLIFTTISLALTILSAYFFVDYFSNHETFRFFFEDLLRVENISGTVVLMLPLAFSLGQILNAALLWFSFDKQYGCLSRELWRTAVHSLAASVVAGYVSFGMLRILDDVFNLETLIGVFMQGFVSGILGLSVAAIILYMIGNREIRIVWETLHKKIWRTRFIGGE